MFFFSPVEVINGLHLNVIVTFNTNKCFLQQDTIVVTSESFVSKSFLVCQRYCGVFISSGSIDLVEVGEVKPEILVGPTTTTIFFKIV